MELFLWKFSIGYCPSHHLLQCTDCQVIPSKFIRNRIPRTPLFQTSMCKDIQTPFRKERTSGPSCSYPGHESAYLSGNIIIMKVDHFRNRIPEATSLQTWLYIRYHRQLLTDGLFHQQSVLLEACVQNHTWNCDIIPKDMQDIPIEKTDSRIIKVQELWPLALLSMASKKS